jgi:tryptophanase
MVEPFRMTTRAEWDRVLRAAHFNPFLIPAEGVRIGLLTDGGTSAVSGKLLNDPRFSSPANLAVHHLPVR